MDSDLSGGERYPSFEQLGPGVFVDYWPPYWWTKDGSANMAAACETLRQINNSETMHRTELKIGEVVYIFVFTTFQVVGFFF